MIAKPSYEAELIEDEVGKTKSVQLLQQLQDRAEKVTKQLAENKVFIENILIKNNAKTSKSITEQPLPGNNNSFKYDQLIVNKYSLESKALYDELGSLTQKLTSIRR